LLILAWKTAGWWGLDRWLLPALGTPWRRGRIYTSRQTGAVPVTGEHEEITELDREDDVEHGPDLNP
jgi:hypothetical protein